MTNKEAIEKLKEILFMTGYKEALNIAIKALEERPHGKWEKQNCFYKCSVCGVYSLDGTALHNYCHNCGADMRGGEDGK